MKTKLKSIIVTFADVAAGCSLILAISALVVGALAAASPPDLIREVTFHVNRNANANADDVRVTFGEAGLDPTTFKPVIQVSIELWDTNSSPPVIIGKRNFQTTVAQMGAWNSAVDGRIFLRNAVTNKVGMTEKP